MTNLRNHAEVEKSLRRLRAMGISCEILPEGDNDCNIFIKLDSVMRFIEKGISYKQKEVKYEEPFIVIHLWKV